MSESGLSRYPVYEETIDNIVGIVLAKDLIPVLAQPARAVLDRAAHAAGVLRSGIARRSRTCSRISSGARSTWRSCSTSTAAPRAS